MFSKKYGFSPEQSIQIEGISDSLRTRIWNIFYKYEIMPRRYIPSIDRDKMTTVKHIIDKLGMNIGGSFLESSLEKCINSGCKWYVVYDFIEMYINTIVFESKKEEIIQEFNRVLEEEKSGYRIVNAEIAPITNESEIEEIESALNTQFESVNTHISKALDLYASRNKPDYENSIKESISAVEAMCCIITNDEKATLGEAISKLEKAGVHIHGAMKNAFSALYGYTSDEAGIRHGSIEFVDAPAEDAKFMLVSCSAFVNYLVEKYSKTDNTKNS